ncbi:DUF4181 domain-containing protein [Sporosarcina gallistercoris]|uniref:DUF4181 domain-containing protein n=1 Tax=Sporosarcina gallistercoris TaxID=2762245 RepID=A0ABR8PF55_9BACL|nr:DUF4181 domain-containing protein [Sporosarcina gallistercoris]MBD7906714.1 DUF4181 domain-containing protein [Sporosarcina gallistercoris]
MDHFYLKLILLLLGFYFVLYLTEFIARKMLKTEKKKFWSNQYVNKKHLKIEWILKGVLTSGLVVVTYFFLSSKTAMSTWFTYFLLYQLFTTVVLESFTAYMEKKYAPRRNQYIVTLIIMLVLSGFILSIITAHSYGLIA